MTTNSDKTILGYRGFVGNIRDGAWYADGGVARVDQPQAPMPYDEAELCGVSFAYSARECLDYWSEGDVSRLHVQFGVFEIPASAVVPRGHDGVGKYFRADPERATLLSEISYEDLKQHSQWTMDRPIDATKDLARQVVEAQNGKEKDHENRFSRN